MTEQKKLSPVYEEEVLRALAVESATLSIEASEKKIKRRLREKFMGAFDQTRVDSLRKFKTQLYREIRNAHKSPYFTPQGGDDADIKDFNTSQMIDDLSAQFPDIPKPVIISFVPYAVYLYYLR